MKNLGDKKAAAGVFRRKAGDEGTKAGRGPKGVRGCGAGSAAPLGALRPARLRCRIDLRMQALRIAGRVSPPDIKLFWVSTLLPAHGTQSSSRVRAGVATDVHENGGRKYQGLCRVLTSTQ